MNKISGSRQSGFTLIELMVSIAVMAIVAVMAVGAWSNQMARYEARSTMIQIAAVMHPVPVVIKAVSDPALTTHDQTTSDRHISVISAVSDISLSSSGPPGILHKYKAATSQSRTEL